MTRDEVVDLLKSSNPAVERALIVLHRQRAFTEGSYLDKMACLVLHQRMLARMFPRHYAAASLQHNCVRVDAAPTSVFHGQYIFPRGSRLSFRQTAATRLALLDRREQYVDALVQIATEKIADHAFNDAHASDQHGT